MSGINNGSQVQLEYVVVDEAGATVESSAESGPLAYQHGRGELPEALEDVLNGKEVGFEAEVHLDKGVAFGEFNVEGIFSVPRTNFPEEMELVPGHWIEVQLENEEGTQLEDAVMEVLVMEVSPESVTLDANHPLAGQAVTFRVKVLSVEA